MSWFWYALLGAFFASLATLLEKRELREVHTFSFSVILATFACIITLPVTLSASWDALTPTILLAMFVAAIIAATAYFSVTKGLRHLEVSVASPILLLTPLVTTLLAYVILRETISTAQLTGMALLMFGLYVLETHDLSDWKDFIKNISGSEYTHYVLAGVVLYGVSSLIDRVILSQYHIPATTYVAIVQTFLAGIFLSWALVMRPGSVNGIATTMKIHWKTIALIALFTTVFRTLQAEAVALASVGAVIAVKRSSALFSTIIGGELFHETNILRKSIACCIMILGVILLALG